MGKILLALLVSASTAFAQSPTEVARAVSELGSAEFRTREAAGERLRAWGDASIQPLQDSLAKGNPESNRRAESLIAQIRQRLTDEAAIAPKIVSVQLARTKLGDIFDELRRQTTYEFRIHGEPTLLAKELDFDTGGKVSVWEAVEKLCAVAGLAVESVGTPIVPQYLAPVKVPQPTLNGEQALLKELRETKLREMEEALDALVARKGKLVAGIAKAAGRERDALKQQLGEAEIELKALGGKLEKLRGLLTAKPELPSPTGTITFMPLSGKPLPTATTAAIRMEAQPVANRSAFTNEQLPVVLKFHPEPGVRWVNVVDAVATKATDAEGRVFQNDHTTRPGIVTNATSKLLLNGSSTYTGTTILKPTHEATLILLAAPGAEVTSPLRMEGIVRANVWTTPEALLTIRDLSADVGTPEDTVPDAFLSAMLVPNPANKLLPYLDVVLSYDMARVKPRTTGAEQHDPPIWLGQGGRGEAVLIKPAGDKPQREMVRNEHGLSLTDAKGNPFVLNLNSAQTTQYNGHDGITIRFTGKFRYTFRPVGTEAAGLPANLAFHGTRIKTISFPFALTDVPVAAGTSLR